MTTDRYVSSRDELPPWLIVLAASSGGIQAIGTVVAALPAHLPAAVVVLQHRSDAVVDLFPDILRMRGAMPVERLGHGLPLRPGRIYVGRPDLHITFERDRRARYINGARNKAILSSADPLLESAARVFQSRLIAVVFTGRGADAADGVQHVHAHAGRVLVQDPAAVEHAGMPSAAIATGAVDEVLPLEAIAPRLLALVAGDGDDAVREPERTAALSS